MLDSLVMKNAATTWDIEHGDFKNVDNRHQLGDRLRLLRTNAGLSGRQLSLAARISQSQLSRIERGTAVPSPSTIEKICAALDLNQRKRQEIRRDSRKLFDDMAKARGGELRSFDGQHLFAAMEKPTKTYRTLSSTWIPGLLQTVDYAATVFEGYATAVPPSLRRTYVDDNVDLRKTRQRMVQFSNLCFQFVIAEQVFRAPWAAPSVLRHQVEKLLEALDEPTIDLTIVPATAPLWVTDSLFEIDDAVIVESTHHNVVFRRHDLEYKQYRSALQTADDLGVSGAAARQILVSYL